MKKTPTLSYQSCFPVYIGYPRITGTSKYRFLAFHSLFPRLRRGQGFLLLLSDILYLAGMGTLCNLQPGSLVGKAEQRTHGRWGARRGGLSQSFARPTSFFALAPLSPTPPPPPFATKELGAKLYSCCRPLS